MHIITLFMQIITPELPGGPQPQVVVVSTQVPAQLTLPAGTYTLSFITAIATR